MERRRTYSSRYFLDTQIINRQRVEKSPSKESASWAKANRRYTILDFGNFHSRRLAAQQGQIRPVEVLMSLTWCYIIIFILLSILFTGFAGPSHALCTGKPYPVGPGEKPIPMLTTTIEEATNWFKGEWERWRQQ